MKFKSSYHTQQTKCHVNFTKCIGIYILALFVSVHTYIDLSDINTYMRITHAF